MNWLNTAPSAFRNLLLVFQMLKQSHTQGYPQNTLNASSCGKRTATEFYQVSCFRWPLLTQAKHWAMNFCQHSIIPRTHTLVGLPSIASVHLALVQLLSGRLDARVSLQCWRTHSAEVIRLTSPSILNWLPVEWMFMYGLMSMRLNLLLKCQSMVYISVQK